MRYCNIMYYDRFCLLQLVRAKFTTQDKAALFIRDTYVHIILSFSFDSSSYGGWLVLMIGNVTLSMLFKVPYC
jgi:hypothetical protein